MNRASGGQRVALRSDPTWRGTVTEDSANGCATVEGDGGWKGRVSVLDLIEVSEDKSWPPAGMETK